MVAERDGDVQGPRRWFAEWNGYSRRARSRARRHDLVVGAAQLASGSRARRIGAASA
jgi:hypothetical protein